MSSILFRSPFSPEECARRLAATMDPDAFQSYTEGWWRTAPHKPVIGLVKGTSLRLRKHINYGNSFQSRLTAEMRPAGTGTIITGRVGMQPLVSVFMAVWFGMVLLIGWPAVLSVLANPGLALTIRHGLHGTSPLLIPPGMLCFGCCLLGGGRFLARGEDRFLTDHLIHTLDVRLAPAG